MTADIINLAERRVTKGAPSARASGEVPLDEAIETCLDHPDVLTDWEIRFVLSIRQSNRGLSAKQQAIMQRLFDKASAAAKDRGA